MRNMGERKEITGPLSKNGLTEYFKDFLNGERGEASAEVLADVVLNAVAEEREACASTGELVAGSWAEANGIRDYPMMDEIAATIRRRGRWYPSENQLTSAVGGHSVDTPHGQAS